MVKISILVPVYNVQTYLAQCINSILEQTLSDIEVICIDDGSTDNSGSILDNLASKDSRVKVIHKKNTGYGDSMNCGLEMAQGEYIGIVESDDFIEKNMYERLYSIAKTNDLDFVKANYYEYGEGKKIYHKIFNEDVYDKVFNNKENLDILKNTTMSIWTGLYKTSFLRNSNIKFLPTPGASYQDISFMFKIYVSANRGYFLNEAYVNYRIDNDSASVKSKGKVYCVCDEINECKKFLEQRNDKLFFMPYLIKIMYSVYMWNLNRISEKYISEFVYYILDELKSAKDNKYIDITLFSEYDRKNYIYLCEFPDKYINERLLNVNNNDDIYMNALIKQFESFNDIYIYGAGKYGKKIQELILKFNEDCNISYAVTEYKNQNCKDIYEINSKKLNKEFPIVVAVINESDKAEMVCNAKEQGFKNIIVLDKIMLEIIKRFEL